MKVDGVELSNAWKPDPLVFNRRDDSGKPVLLVFEFEGVKSFEEFEKLCPKPEPKKILIPGEGWKEDPRHPGYRKDIDGWLDRRREYLFFRTITAIYVMKDGKNFEAVEWEQTNLAEVKTWHKAEEELNAILAPYEMEMVRIRVREANSLDDQKLEENLESFFQSRQAEQAESTSTDQSPESTDSLEPVTAGA